MKNLIPAHKIISENRFREISGLVYENFTIGDIYEHRPGRTVTEADNLLVTLLSMNKHPLHLDSEYAADSEFKKILINSPVTFAIINGMTVQTLSANAICNLGWDKVRLHKPVFVGDTLYAESKILNKRESKSRSHAGIVTVETMGINQKKEVVIRFERTFMVLKKDSVLSNNY